jgi:hypothetical protein
MLKIIIIFFLNPESSDLAALHNTVLLILKFYNYVGNIIFLYNINLREFHLH